MIAKGGRRPVEAIASHQRKMKENQENALLGYEQTGTITGACQFAGVTRSTWYAWKRKTKKFATAVAEVEQVVADSLEREAFRRAYGGSDSLLIFLLKGMRPEKYNERRFTVKKHVIDNSTVDDVARAISTTTKEKQA